MARRRAYLFGIGSPAWQRAVGQTVNGLGVPIPSHGPSKRRLRVTHPATFGFSSSSSHRRKGRRR